MRQCRTDEGTEKKKPARNIFVYTRVKLRIISNCVKPPRKHTETEKQRERKEKKYGQTYMDDELKKKNYCCEIYENERKQREGNQTNI